MESAEVVEECSALAQAHVLASPMRYRLLRQVIAAGTVGIGVDELAQHLGLTRTAVRLHLARLIACGLVVADPCPSARPGRPRLRYRSTPAAIPWADGDPFEQIARALASVSDRSRGHSMSGKRRAGSRGSGR
jgi:predicted ArsR family transcriptional regulator